MSLRLGDQFPNFEVETTDGKLKIHDHFKDSWFILFSHPADYTPVCTTELARVVKLKPEFDKRGVKLIALSCDSCESHKGWSKDVMRYANDHKPTDDSLPYPIIADPKRDIAHKLGMIDPEEKDKAGIPLTCRAVFIVDDKMKVKLSILYPATTGRNFDEILRVIDSLKMTAYQKVATPVDWKHGEECMVLPSVSPEEAKKLFPKHRMQEVASNKSYLRFTPDPSQESTKK